MHHELFGDLRYNADDQLWTGSVILRQFAAFGEARYDGLYNEESERLPRHEGILSVTIWERLRGEDRLDGSGRRGEAGPTAQQEAAYRFLLDNETEVFRATLGAIFQCYKDYTDSPSPLRPLWRWLGRWLGLKPIESPEGLASEASFMSLEIAREYQGDAAWVLFNFECSWEPEHGMMVVYHKNRPATWTSIDDLELETDG